MHSFLWKTSRQYRRQEASGAMSGHLEAADGDPRQQAAAWAGYRAFCELFQETVLVQIGLSER